MASLVLLSKKVRALAAGTLSVVEILVYCNYSISVIADIANMRFHITWGLTMKIFRAVACFVGCLSGASMAAPAPNFSGNPASTALQSNLDTRFIQAMQYYNVPGLATVVVRDGTVRWLQTYGVLDRSKSDSLASNKVAITTPFRIASVSKTLTAVVALRMAESPVGYFFSDYVDDYLPLDMPVVNPAFPNSRITLPQLLTHSSTILDVRPPTSPPANISDATLAGIIAAAASNTLTYTDTRIIDWLGAPGTATAAGYGDHEYYAIGDPPSDGPFNLEQYLRRVLVPGGADYPIPSFSPNRSYLAAQPGTVYAYNNVNTSLLGLVIERAAFLKGASKPFSQIADEVVFQPLGMTRSSFSLSSTSATVLAATAVPHDVTGAAAEPIGRKAMVNAVCRGVPGCIEPYSVAETTSNNYEPLPQYGGAERPAKSARASIEDLAKFVSMLASRGSVAGTQFLAQSTVDAMTTNQLGPNVHPEGTETGFGLFRLILGAGPVVANDSVWGHQGGDAGVSACLLFSKTTRYGVVVVMNSPSDGQICTIAQDLYAEVCRSEGVCPQP